MLCKLISCTLVAAALGKITWTPTDIQLRRLGFELAASHIDTSDASCIVGGYDVEHPQKVYIGGPCSELSCSGTSCVPSNGFKWVEMESVHMSIGGSDGSTAPFEPVPGSAFVYPEDGTEYAEIQVGGSQYLEEAAMGHAAIFIGTTSYLAKASFSFTENDFAVEMNADGTVKGSFRQCVVPCCANPGSTGCECASGCPTQALQAVPGAYKFSIMAASYDFPTVAGSTYVAGVSGNGWEKVVDTYGTEVSGSKTLQNVNMDYYQVIDFTNMKADTLTVTAPSGTSKKYVDLTACDLTNSATACTDATEMSSVTLSSDSEFSLTYDFPQTSNMGSWTSTDVPVEQTRKVQIHCMKPDAATLVAWEMATDTTAAALMKIVLVRYRFDINGITATETTGKWMNYYATITSTNSATSSTGTAATTSSGTTTAGTSSTTSSTGTAATTSSGTTTAGTSSGTTTTGTATGTTGVTSAATLTAPRTLAHFSLLALMAAMTGIAFM